LHKHDEEQFTQKGLGRVWQKLALSAGMTGASFSSQQFLLPLKFVSF